MWVRSVNGELVNLQMAKVIKHGKEDGSVVAELIHQERSVMLARPGTHEAARALINSLFDDIQNNVRARDLQPGT